MAAAPKARIIVRVTDHCSDDRLKAAIGGAASGQAIRPDGSIRPGVVVEIEKELAYEKWVFLTHATVDELREFEALMKEVVRNQKATAKSGFHSESEKSGTPRCPCLIVRFLLCGSAKIDRSCDKGEIRVVEKDFIWQQLLHKPPIVALATPAELKSYQDLEAQIEKCVAQRIKEKKRRQQVGITEDVPDILYVRFLKQGLNSDNLPCDPGEVWPLDREYAIRLLRAKSPVITLATEAEWRGYQETLIQKTPSGTDPKCSPCQQKAFGQYLEAKQRYPDIVTDNDAFERVQCDVEDDELPRKETWIRYVRHVRRSTGTQKNSPRGPRTGHSVVPQKDL